MVVRIARELYTHTEHVYVVDAETPTVLCTFAEPDEPEWAFSAYAHSTPASCLWQLVGQLTADQSVVFVSNDGFVSKFVVGVAKSNAFPNDLDGRCHL